MARYVEEFITPETDIARPDIETQLTTHFLSTGNKLDTFTADGRWAKDCPTLLVSLPWSEYTARPDARDRYMAIACSLGVRVIALDNLGVGNGTSKLKGALARDVRRGNFDGVAEQQWEAVSQIEPNIEHQPIEGFSYSMGGALLAALAKTSPRDVSFDRVIMAETVGVHPQSWGRLAMNFAHEIEAWDRYWSENPDWMHRPGNDPTMARRMATQTSGYTSYPLGLTHARILDDISAAYEHGGINTDTKVRIISGQHSRVSPIADNIALADRYIQLGVTDVRQRVLLDETHGMIDSVNRLIPALRSVDS